MKLEDEASLVDYFIKQKHKNKKSIILTEVETNYGRPDVLQIFIDNKVYTKRKLELNPCQFSNQMSFAMTYLYGKKWIKFNTLQRFLHLYDTQFNRVVDSLLKRQLIEIKDGDYIKSKKSSEILAIKRIVAYEAKLFKWKDVIEQAERHLWFTSESYVILPQKSDKINNLIEERCKENNIGLVYFNQGEFSTRIRVNKKRIINCPFVWKLNEFLIEGEKDG